MISYISTRIACYNGLIVQAAINNLLPLFYVIIQRDFNVSVEKLGMLTAVNFVTQLLVDLFAAAFVDRLGWRRSICLSHILAVAGFAALSFLPGMIDPYMAVVISVIVYASGSAIIEVMVSPIVEALPSTDKGGQMALLHSFYCWGQLAVVLLSTVALAVFGEWLWKYLPLFWAIVPIVNFFLFLKTPLVIPDHVQEKKRLGSELRALFTNPMFLLMMLMMLCAGACELAMAQWASYFAEAALGTSKLLGDLLGPCMFALFMGAGRLTYSLAQRKPSPPQIVAMCAGLCIVCYAVAGLSGNAYVLAGRLCTDRPIRFADVAVYILLRGLVPPVGRHGDVCTAGDLRRYRLLRRSCCYGIYCRPFLVPYRADLDDCFSDAPAGGFCFCANKEMAAQLTPPSLRRAVL